MGGMMDNDRLMEMQPKPGTYVLILECPAPVEIDAGGLGSLLLEPGWYAYVGSAFGPGGVRARCLRHWRGARPHWHIDYLRPLCVLHEIWYTQDAHRREHQWAELMRHARGASIPFLGFGASDCVCPSHLFQAPRAFSFPSFKRRAHAGIPGHAYIHRCLLSAL